VGRYGVDAFDQDRAQWRPAFVHINTDVLYSTPNNKYNIINIITPELLNCNGEE
jgi:hypothetical protein